MSSASDPGILKVRNAKFSYSRDGSFIEGLSFSVGEGEFIGLLGANGSGKSTILKLCSGILRPSSGDIILWEKPLRTYSTKDRAKLISYLPQSLDATVPFTVKELVSMGLYPYDIPPAMTAGDAIDLVGLTDKADAHLTDLSGGEKRRTFIAMTLLQGAGLLLLDEPLANLDIKYQIELIRLLKKLISDRNISVVMALHDINIAMQFEKVMLIRNANIIGSGPPGEVLTDGLLRDAFDVEVKVARLPGGKAFVNYENNF
jgi:ABC-type cobalamin/Fe3+-siderophores transport system ATPase subunit